MQLGKILAAAGLILLSVVLAWGQQGNERLNGAVNREGGVMVLMRACHAMTKGNVVQASTTLQLGIQKCVTTAFDAFGVVYSDASGSSTIASGSWCWIVHSGPVQVLTSGAVSATNILCTSTTVAGTADDVGSPPPVSTSDHFREVGHLLESKSVATLAWAIIHWN